MLLEMRGQRIERFLDTGLIVEPATCSAQPCEPCSALRIVGEEPVQIGAGNTTGSGDRAVVATVGETGERPRRVGAGGFADMHFVSGQGSAVRGRAVNG